MGIENFLIISDTGDFLFSRDYNGKNHTNHTDLSLLSGFISAIRNFAESIGEGQIRTMVIANRKWLYTTKHDLIGIAIAAQEDNDDLIKMHFLIPLLNQFIEEYKEELFNHSGEYTVFDSFQEMTDTQREVYRAQAAEQSVDLTTRQALTLQGAIELVNVDSIALVLRHAANHKLVLVGDDFMCKKLGALIQSMIPIHVTSELNGYTDLYISSKYPNNPDVEFSTFNVDNRGWTHQKYPSALYEKTMIQNLLKKKGLGDMDLIFIVIGFALVAIAYLKSPIQIYFAPVIAQRLIVINNHGIPLLTHDFCEPSEKALTMDSTLISGALSGIVNILQEALESDSIPTMLKLEDRVLLLEKSNSALYALIVDDESMVLRSALKDFAKEFEKAFKHILKDWKGLTDLFDDAYKLITEDFSFILTSRRIDKYET